MLVLGAVGAGCIVAAGVGGFLAMHVSAPARGAEAPAAWTTATVPSPSVTPTPDVPAPAEPTVLLPASAPEAPKSKSSSSGGRKRTLARSKRRIHPRSFPPPRLHRRCGGRAGGARSDSGADACGRAAAATPAA